MRRGFTTTTALLLVATCAAAGLAAGPSTAKPAEKRAPTSQPAGRGAAPTSAPTTRRVRQLVEGEVTRVDPRSIAIRPVKRGDAAPRERVFSINAETKVGRAVAGPEQKTASGQIIQNVRMTPATLRDVVKGTGVAVLFDEGRESAVLIAIQPPPATQKAN